MKVSTNMTNRTIAPSRAPGRPPTPRRIPAAGLSVMLLLSGAIGCAAEPPAPAARQPGAAVRSGIASAPVHGAAEETAVAGPPPLVALEAEAPALPIFLNHVYTTLATPTYRALRDSAWLGGTFSNVVERTTVRPDITYTGLYLLFERTYLEFFEVSEAFPSGGAGLALSDETAGGMVWATDRMVSTFGADRVATGLISRTVDGQAVPWFHFAIPDGVFSPLFSTWNMEFVTPPGAAQPPTRQQDRAATFDPTKLARNVLGVAYALTLDDARNLGQLLAALAWNVGDFEDGRFLALSPIDAGVRRAVAVRPATTSPTCQGITAIALALSGHADHVEQLGEARLVAGVLGKKLAVLTLQPPTCSDDLAAAVGPLVPE